MYLQELDCTELLLTGELWDDLSKLKGEFLWWLSDNEQSDLLEGGLKNARKQGTFKLFYLELKLVETHTLK